MSQKRSTVPMSEAWEALVLRLKYADSLLVTAGEQVGQRLPQCDLSSLPLGVCYLAALALRLFAAVTRRNGNTTSRACPSASTTIRVLLSSCSSSHCNVRNE